MRFFQLLILGSVISCSAGIKAFADAPIVPTQNGDVRGVLQGAVESFKGLPFAAPPVGDLRWKPPQDPANWNGVRDGSQFRPMFGCPQKIPGTNDSVIGREDCLYLNVFRPKDAQALPVIVFIHGGHNAIGSAGEKNINNEVAVYDGSELAQNGNVVVVTINYRLGALGFVAHPELSKESGYGGSGNYGHMDQIQALKWVSRNIAAFGGDPNKVTLFGQSTGGGGVLVLLASRLAQGLFHRAIILSGQLRMQDRATAEMNGKAFSQKLECRSTPEEPSTPDELRCMRRADFEKIVVARPGGHENDPAPSVRGPSHFLPVVDQRVLRNSPLDVVRGGMHNHMPILMGNAAEETSYIYYEESKDLHTEQGYIKEVKAHYPPDLLNLYVPGDYLDFVVDYVEMEGRLQPRVTLRPSPRKAYNAISADHWFVCPARSFAQALSANQSEFVGRFLYTHVLPGPLGFYGASHGFASVFVFGTFGYYEDKQWNPTPDELILRTKFQKTWGDFARWGSPGAFWNRYDAAQDNYVMFNTSMSSGTQLRTRQCDHWDEVDRPAAGIRPAAEVQPADVFVGAVKSVARPRIVNEGSLPQIGGQK